MRTTKILLLFAVTSFTTLAKAQSINVSIDTLIARSHRLGLFNGNVLIIDHGKEVYRKAVGYADASKQVKLTDEYRFHIGSIAKEFNAVGIMMLQEQGKLNIDDKISKYLPALPGWASTISIKNLLQYTSGVPDVNWKTVTGDASNMQDLQNLKKLDFEPGTQYNYNNNNVFLQRRIIEKVTGVTFKHFVETMLLKPAGMSNAVIDPDDSTPLVAKSYNNDNKQGSMVYPITGWTAVTIDDFHKWELAIENYKLISPTSTKILLTPFETGKQCGLGGGRMENDKLTLHQHDGSSIYYQALLVGKPVMGRVVILMTNNKQNNIFDIDNAIENILDGKPYVQIKRSILADFKKEVDSLSGRQLLVFYKGLKQNYPDKYAYDNETTLNEIGYGLLANRPDDAIVIFEYNTKLFPQSGNVFDSLGEAYYNKGDKAKALASYKRSLALDPTNTNAKAYISKLEK